MTSVSVFVISRLSVHPYLCVCVAPRITVDELMLVVVLVVVVVVVTCDGC